VPGPRPRRRADRRLERVPGRTGHQPVLHDHGPQPPRRPGDARVSPTATSATSFRSRYISPSQYRGLQNLGDGMCPGDDEFPSFSECGCGEHVDEILELMNPNDLAQLQQLLTAASVMPAFAVQRLLKLAERSPHMSDSNP